MTPPTEAQTTTPESEDDRELRSLLERAKPHASSHELVYGHRGIIGELIDALEARAPEPSEEDREFFLRCSRVNAPAPERGYRIIGFKVPDDRFQYLHEGIDALVRALSPSPDTRMGELAAFGASEAACYFYPGEDQQAERAAFCAGAAHHAKTPEPVLTVPRTPTEAMMDAGLYHCSADMTWADLHTAWQAMFDTIALDGGVTTELPALATTRLAASSREGGDTLRSALEAAVRDLEATYEAAKSGKPIETSIGQFGRLSRMKAVLASPAMPEVETIPNALEAAFAAMPETEVRVAMDREDFRRAVEDAWHDSATQTAIRLIDRLREERS